MIVFDFFIFLMIFLAIKHFFEIHPYLNGCVCMMFVGVMNVSFWMPLNWHDLKIAEPMIGQYDKSKGDTVYVYYATYNAESIVKRNYYIIEEKNKIIKCISLDDYESLYLEDIKKYSLNNYNIIIERDSITKDFNWNYTIFEWQNNTLVSAK